MYKPTHDPMGRVISRGTCIYIPSPHLQDGMEDGVVPW